MRWDTWSLFLITETVLCLTPGPAVLFVLAQALGRSPRAALWAALGILAGNAFYFVLSATSLGAILMASHDLFFAIRWAGAAYLLWLGFPAFFSAAPVLSLRPTARTGGGAQLLRRGFIVQTANPKALVFFTAFLPQFIDPVASVSVQVTILAVTSVAVEFVVLAAYGALAGRAIRLAANPRHATLANRIAGVLLIGAGLRMAALRVRS